MAVLIAFGLGAFLLHSWSANGTSLMERSTGQQLISEADFGPRGSLPRVFGFLSMPHDPRQRFTDGAEQVEAFSRLGALPLDAHDTD